MAAQAPWNGEGFESDDVKKYKSLAGIGVSALYGLILRLLAEVNFMDIDSYSFLFVTPFALSYIPFFLRDEHFLGNLLKVIFYPIIAIVIFFLILFISHLEDLICLLILGLPYLGISILLSLILRLAFYRSNDSERYDENGPLDKLSLPILLLPVILGLAERKIPKKSSELTIFSSILIHKNAPEVWKHLFSIPKLSAYTQSNLLNSLGMPIPSHSSYDSLTKIRKGFFSHGIVFQELVIKQVANKELVFQINLDHSELGNMPTLQHVLKNKKIVFNSISYKIQPIKKGMVKLELSTDITTHSNLTFYSNFWGKILIRNFEEQLLEALKKQLENP